ncbi:MAG: TetR/AcrR family transcriptional regulator [Acidimicrobiia bacterium]|nr:TetR/AcrR family transcriptional regulator [Acidimicrobiia bacterium]
MADRTPTTPSRQSAARLPAAERRRQLLDAAIDVFGDRGFHSASMNEVADAAGVTKPVLYQHFPSKRELYRELLAAMGDRLRTEVAEAVAAADGPRSQVEQGFGAYFDWVARHQGGFQVIFAGETRRDAEFAAELARVETEMASAIASLIVVEGLDSERRRLLAYGIVGMAETTARHWVADHLDVDAGVLAAQVAELAWAGLRGLQPAAEPRSRR